MFYLRKLLIASLSVAVLASVAVAGPPAQKSQQIIKPFRKISIGKGSPIDTTTFGSATFIDRSMARVIPENPDLENWKDHRFNQNSLPVGGTINAQRVTPGPLWPAIGATGWTPADPTLAVGPNNVIVTANCQIAFYDRSGTQQYNQPAQTFFSGLGATSFQFDPRVLYDKSTGRWYVIFDEEQGSPQVSKILLAVSDDSDPNGTWYRYRIEAKYTSPGGSTYWMDYPSIGYNKDGLTICGNMFGFSSGFGGTEFITIPKAPLLSGGAATASYILDTNAGSVQLADMAGSSSNYAYGIEDWTTTSLKLHALGNLTGTPTYTTTIITIPSFNYPTSSAPSSPGYLDTLDGRMYEATWRNGKVLCMHTTTSGGVNRVRWYEVNINNWPSGSPALAQAGDVVPSGGPHFHMGGVAENWAGDISVNFTRSASSGVGMPCDFMAAGHKFSDGLGVTGTPILLQSSFGSTYGSSGTNRWGDYFRTVVDPVDDFTFWGVGMVANAGGGWQTVVNSWTISTQTMVPPASYNLFRGKYQSGALSDLANSDDNRLVLQPGPTLNSGESPIMLELNATAPTSALGGLKFVLEGQVSTNNLGQTIELFDWTTNTWVTIDDRAASVNNDMTIEAIAAGNLSRFVQSGTNAVKARVRVQPIGPVTIAGWVYRFDQTVWKFVY